MPLRSGLTNLIQRTAAQVKFFTNFSCEGGRQLLKHALNFAVELAILGWLFFKSL
jgi:hypothetical protein